MQDRDLYIENRKRAMEAGEKRFNGAPCRVCGHIERYTKSGACITCNRARQSQLYAKRGNSKSVALAEGRDARMLAMKNLQQLYEGAPCRVCGTTTRYTSNNVCKLCNIARAEHYRLRVRKAMALLESAEKNMDIEE